MGIKKTELQLQIINRIKSIRLCNNISQRQLADMLDISYGEVGNIESVKYKNKYTLKQLVTISKILNIPISTLFFGESEKEKMHNFQELLDIIIQYLD